VRDEYEHINEYELITIAHESLMAEEYGITSEVEDEYDLINECDLINDYVV